MDRWKAEQGRGREKRKLRREKSRRERVRRKKMQMREKVGKLRNIVFFQWFGAPEDRKVGSLKRRVRSQLARWEMKNCTPLWREAHFQLKRYKAHHGRTTFGSWDVEKVHTVVAWSTFRSENVQNTPWSDHFWKLRCRNSARRCGAKHILKSKCTNTPASDHFWKLRCRKSVRRCGAKHISKSKFTKHTMYGPFLEVQMSKKCTPLWREAHFQVKMYKTHHVRTIFGGSDVVSRGRRKGLWTLSKVSIAAKREGFVAFSTTTTTTLHYTTLHYTTLHCHYTPIHYTTLQLQLQLHLHYILLHYTPLHYTALNYATLHYITLHYTTLRSHYTTLHYTTLHYSTLQLQLHHYTPLHSATLNYTTLHYITLHSTTLHYITQHYLTLNDTAPQIDR